MSKLDKKSIIGISALLVHAANIDENYSAHEKELIKEFIKSCGQENDIESILKKSYTVHMWRSLMYKRHKIDLSQNFDEKSLWEKLKKIVNDNKTKKTRKNISRKKKTLKK